MAETRNRPPGAYIAVGSAERTEIPRATRAGLAAPVRVRYRDFAQFVQMQSTNVSRTGMFIATNEVVELGTVLEFEIGVEDGGALLRGKGEVVRISRLPRGLGLKFIDLDEASTKLIERVVEYNKRHQNKPGEVADAGDKAKAPMKGATMMSRGVTFSGAKLILQINPITIGYFTVNPLLTIKSGGFVVPGEREVPLGTVFDVTINDMAGKTMLACQGKVVVMLETRLGIRLVQPNPDMLANVQAEVAKYSK